jgi:DegV family protein with EDD domain
MAVKIITDSLSDITGDLVKKLRINVVPLYVRFGEEVYRDRIEMTTDEFYRRLVTDTVFPSTTQPTPHDFLAIYQELAKETDEILVITLSSQLSGTYQSALQAKNLLEGKCRIEIVDSQTAGMGLGLIVISTVEAARKGASLGELVDFVQRAMGRSHLIAYFDTLKYLAKGGRIGKAQGFVGSVLSFKPILTIKDGVISPVTRLRSRAAGIDYLYNSVANYPDIEALAVEHCTTPDDAEALIERLGSFFPRERIYQSTISPVVGAHAGPGALAITVLEAEKA